jgi:TRAP-type mannitol/chloroaromatic compound transport system permease small subunit
MANGHIRVDILMERLTPKGQALFDAITICRIMAGSHTGMASLYGMSFYDKKRCQIADA